MPKQVLRPSNLSFQPRPEYPYSPGTRGGHLVYTAGQVAWNERAELVGIGDPRAQTRQVLANVESVLREGGATLADVLKCNVYLADIGHFQVMNEVFVEVFATSLRPARPSRPRWPSPRCWSRSKPSPTSTTEGTRREYVPEVLEPPPADLTDSAVAVAMADGWGFRVQTVEYLPVGAGGYHWNVTDSTGRSLFVTADDLDTKDWLGDDRDAIADGLNAALDTASRLRHDVHLGFVVAPLAAGDGRPAVRLGDRYAISVYPWLEGSSHPFGHQADPARRESTLDMLIALDMVDPPAGIPHHACPRVGARRDLEAFLHEPADPWNEGPLGEPARPCSPPTSTSSSHASTPSIGSLSPRPLGSS